MTRYNITQQERLDLVLKGYSRRVEDYLLIRELKDKTLREIEAETGCTIPFITACREIARQAVKTGPKTGK